MIIDIRKFKSFPSFKKRFLSYFPKNYQDASMIDSCWNYEGTLNANSVVGYGRINYGYTFYQAHRMSYITFKGPVRSDQIVRHTCDNPRCVNPKHLIIGTLSDNNIDSLKRNRGTHQKLNVEAVKVIKWFLKYQPSKGLTIKLARLHNVASSTISNIKAGRNWSWVKV